MRGLFSAKMWGCAWIIYPAPVSTVMVFGVCLAASLFGRASFLRFCFWLVFDRMVVPYYYARLMRRSALEA